MGILLELVAGDGLVGKGVLGVEVVEHGDNEFFVIEGDEILFKIEWFGARGNVLFVGFSIKDGFFLDGEEDFGG